jgi:menaquinone-specific isochorismate synthase
VTSDRGARPAPMPGGLRAVTRGVSAVGDLLDALGPDGFLWAEQGAGLATSGIAATVPAAQVHDVLGAIATDDEVDCPGTGPIAVGALAFDRSVDATLTIPARVVGRDAAGNGWITHIGPLLEPVPAPSPHPTRFRVTAVQSREWWQHAVVAALGRIARGDLAKVVLAREVTVDADAPFDLRAVLRRLRSQQPGCVLYTHRGLVGATPELLIRRSGRTIESRPMAGTAPGWDRADVVARLGASGKDAREHRFVVDAVRDVLAPLTTALEIPEHPEVEHFGNLAHLVTPIRASLVDPGMDALSLARLLHPSPAVGGTPTDAALQVIDELEPFDRGPYAGPVGWVDARGDGAFAVALRGAELDGAHALLRAGAGIVAGSDPDAEWVETAAKFEPMLRALVVP